MYFYLTHKWSPRYAKLSRPLVMAMKAEKQEPKMGEAGEPPFKQRVTQSISSLKEAKCKENMEQQERRWIQLTQERKVSSSCKVCTCRIW